MRAVQLTGFGGPEVLELVELDVPEPAEDQVLIRVSRAGVNFAATHQRENAYIAKQQLPLVPGGAGRGERRRQGRRRSRDGGRARPRAEPGGARAVWACGRLRDLDPRAGAELERIAAAREQRRRRLLAHARPPAAADASRAAAR